MMLEIKIKTNIKWVCEVKWECECAAGWPLEVKIIIRFPFEYEK